jgi:hypothetical protein
MMFSVQIPDFQFFIGLLLYFSPFFKAIIEVIKNASLLISLIICFVMLIKKII